MTNRDVSFADWFDHLILLLADRGFRFADPDSVRDDYDHGRSVFDVADAIVQEYT